MAVLFNPGLYLNIKYFSMRHPILHFSRFQPRKLTMSSCLSQKSPLLPLTPTTKWSNATRVMASTWLAACCTEATLCRKMSMPPSPTSKPSAKFNLLTGARPVLKLASTTNRQQLFLVSENSSFYGILRNRIVHSLLTRVPRTTQYNLC